MSRGRKGQPRLSLDGSPSEAVEHSIQGVAMSKELMDIVLPRLAQRLNRHLRRYRAGKLDDDQFSQKFETLLQQQYSWLANQGIPEVEAAVAVHGAVLVLSGPGLRAEAAEQSIPLEVIEYRAILAAASDISEHYGVSEQRATRRLASIVAYYAE
jgi:hypothetical protein